MRALAIIGFALLFVAALPAGAKSGGIATMGSTMDLKAAAAVSVPCGDKPPYSSKQCVLDILYFQGRVVTGTLADKVLVRCTCQMFNGAMQESCEFEK